MGGEPFDMQLVDDGLTHRAVERAIALPVVEVKVGDNTLERPCPAMLAGGLTLLAPIGRRHRHPQAVGIEQELLRVTPQACCGLVGTVHPVAIELPGSKPRHPPVPVVTGAMLLTLKG